MRESWEWTEDDLLRLIKNGTAASITLNFKRCAAISLDLNQNYIGGLQ
jgi:hypothetical protein